MSENMGDEPEKHPVIVWELVKGCKGFDEGMKYKLETISGDEFFCRDYQHMRQFLNFHGCMGVSKERMDQLRDERLDKSRREDTDD